MQHGKLYLIPSPLGENALHTIPPYVVEIIHRIEFVVAERAKTARHFIKATGTPRPMPTYHVSELNGRTPDHELSEMLAPVLNGKDVGIFSEAGCPGVADPVPSPSLSTWARLLAWGQLSQRSPTPSRSASSWSTS